MNKLGLFARMPLGMVIGRLSISIYSIYSRSFEV